jgi:hypothetical protein
MYAVSSVSITFRGITPFWRALAIDRASTGLAVGLTTPTSGTGE